MIDGICILLLFLCSKEAEMNDASKKGMARVRVQLRSTSKEKYL